MSQETFDLSLLEGEFTDRAVVNESNKKDTVYKGNYQVTVKKASLVLGDEKSMSPGRRIVNLQVGIDKGDGKTVSQFVKVSPDVRRKITIGGEAGLVGPEDPGYDKALPLDSQSKLWGHIEAVVNPTGELDKASIVKELPGTTLNAYILEGFRTASGGMEFPDGDPAKDLTGYEASRSALLSAGHVPMNFFSSFKAVK